jgi:hypothetical protein
MMLLVQTKRLRIIALQRVFFWYVIFTARCAKQLSPLANFIGTGFSTWPITNEIPSLIFVGDIVMQ